MSGVAATKKLNIKLPEATEFSLLPLVFTGKRKKKEDYNPFTQPNGGALPRGEIKILSLIWTEKRNYGSKTKITKAHIRRKTGLSKGGVKNALKNLEARGLLKEVKDNVYKIVPKIQNERYIVLENYLHTTKFEIEGKPKKLTQTAVIILERICSFYREFKIDAETGEKIYTNYNFKTRKVINYFRGSEKSLAKYLGLPDSTVGYGILELLHAGLMFRNKQLRYKDENGNVRTKTVQTKETPGNTLSLFTVPYEVLAVEQHSTYKEQEVEFVEELAEIEVSEDEIQEAYAELRSEAEAKAVKAREIVNGDKEFCEIRAELKKAASSSEIARIAPRYIKRLTEFDLTEEDLNPQYQCTLCDDTGTNIDTGQRCLCRARIKQRIIESKLKA